MRIAVMLVIQYIMEIVIIFVDDMESYIDKAYEIQDNQDNYNIQKEI